MKLYFFKVENQDKIKDIYVAFTFIGVCHVSREACLSLTQFLSTDKMESNSVPPRKRFPIPLEVFCSPSVLEEFLISDDDYKTTNTSQYKNSLQQPRL